MTYFIKLPMLSKDAAIKRKTKARKTKLMRVFNFKKILD